MTPFDMGVFTGVLGTSAVSFFLLLLIRNWAYRVGYEEGWDIGFSRGQDVGYDRGWFGHKYGLEHQIPSEKDTEAH